MKYRIVKDGLFYEAQARPRWWPFWFAIGGEYSLHATAFEAKKVIERYKKYPLPVVVYEEEAE